MKFQAQLMKEALDEVNKGREKPLLLIEAFHYKFHPLAKRLKDIVDHWGAWSDNVVNCKSLSGKEH